MQQKDLLAYLHNFIQRKETTDSADILEKRAVKPEVPTLDKNTEDAITALYNILKKYNIPSEILFSLHHLAEKLDPQDNSIINVLHGPNPDNINALIAAAQKLDDDYIEKNGSVANLCKEVALTGVAVVKLLLICIFSVLLFPIILLGSCLSSTSCFSSTSGPMSYCQFLMDTFLAIGDSIEKTEDEYDNLTYDNNTAVAKCLIGFFKPQPAKIEVTFLNTQPFR